MNTIISTLLIMGLLFGGGATVNAAQDDQPNEPLYELKIWSEDFGLRFQNGVEGKVNRLMELAQIRVQEMTSLNEANEPIPDQVRLRLEQHIQQALQICLTLDEPTLDRTLLQIRDRLQDQDRDMERLQLQTQDQLRLQTQDQLQLLTQTRTMLRDRLRLVDEGLLNHEMFRNRVQNGFRFGQEDEVIPPVQNGNGQQQQQQQNGQPSLEPNGPNTDPGGPNLTPGEPNMDPGGPNTNPGGPNTDPGGPNTDPGGNNDGSGSGGNDAEGGEPNNNGSGGNGK